MATTMSIIAVIAAYTLGMMIGAGARRAEYGLYNDGGLLDEYTVNVIRERIAGLLDDLEDSGNIGSVTGLYTALDVIADIEEESRYD